MVDYQTIAELVNQISVDTWHVLREIKQRRNALIDFLAQMLAIVTSWRPYCNNARLALLPVNRLEIINRHCPDSGAGEGHPLAFRPPAQQAWPMRDALGSDGRGLPASWRWNSLLCLRQGGKPCWNSIPIALIRAPFGAPRMPPRSTPRAGPVASIRIHHAQRI